MVLTRKHEKLVGWTDRHPKNQVPMHTNYPAMRAKDADKEDCHRSYKPQLERWVVERKLRTGKGDGIVASIRKILKL